MAMHDFVAATARPLPVIILADISGSMAGDGKIENLNMAIKTMIASFAKERVLKKRAAQSHLSKRTFS